MKFTKDWLRNKLEKYNMTQRELAEITGLSTETINKLVRGIRLGNEKTWKIIETAFDETKHTITFETMSGDTVEINILGNQRAIFEMIEIAKENGFDEKIVGTYIKSMEGLFYELVQSQDDIINSYESYTFDEHNQRVLITLANDFMNDFDTLLRYFPHWLGLKFA